MTSNDRTALSSAIKVSAFVAVLMLLVKLVAYLISGSAAILGDVAASVVQIISLIFAAIGLCYTPTEQIPPYNQNKFGLFSAGFEGAIIILAAIITLVFAVFKWEQGTGITGLETSTILITVAASINALLGFYLIRTGKFKRSLLVESNGNHVLTNCLTSIAVIVGLLLYSYSEIKFIDPLVALIIVGYILLSGFELVRKSFGGLQEKADPAITKQLTELLSQRCAIYGIRFHKLHHRNMSDRHWVEVHLLFPEKTEIGEAHRIAGEIEVVIISSLANRAHILTHLEAIGVRK